MTHGGTEDGVTGTRALCLPVEPAEQCCRSAVTLRTTCCYLMKSVLLMLVFLKGKKAIKKCTNEK